MFPASFFDRSYFGGAFYPALAPPSSSASGAGGYFPSSYFGRSYFPGSYFNALYPVLPPAPCSWEKHFVDHGWDSPQEQIDAGYPLYIQPTLLTGSYTEVIDYGVVINNVIVIVNFNLNIISPTVGVVVKMAVSTDDITYSALTLGASQFFATFRYLKVRLEFTSTDDKAVAILTNLIIQLDVKLEQDGGEITANAGDAGGTVVLFNKAFKDVRSITLGVKSTTVPYTAIYDFVAVPNPVSFKIYAYDAAGARVTKSVSWQARGIV